MMSCFGSQPSLFGYYLYLRYGHLSCQDFGSVSLKDTFDSAINFQDGDVLSLRIDRCTLVILRRRNRFGSEVVGGRGLSISRSFYSLFWRDD